jgi:hypothetical protein
MHFYYWEGGTCLESVGWGCAGAVCSGRGPVSNYDCRQANEKVNQFKEKNCSSLVSRFNYEKRKAYFFTFQFGNIITFYGIAYSDLEI